MEINHLTQGPHGNQLEGHWQHRATVEGLVGAFPLARQLACDLGRPGNGIKGIDRRQFAQNGRIGGLLTAGGRLEGHDVADPQGGRGQQKGNHSCTWNCPQAKGK